MGRQGHSYDSSKHHAQCLPLNLHDYNFYRTRSALRALSSPSLPKSVDNLSRYNSQATVEAEWNISFTPFRPAIHILP